MVLEVKRPLKVFLCHASGDKPYVRDLYKRLVAEGVDAWLDQEKLLPGQDWRVEIPRAVRDADVVVICLSNKSITKEGYVQKEIRFALDSAEEKPEGTIFLIPARLEECVVPERLDRWQWVDLYEENGYIRLLRSLQIRANVVGATIEPLEYESEDQETDRRLEKLYTEGLAAFWVEDWDRACQRFQTILRERPNHKNAAEKLAQAERQRSLAKLYVQATEAYQSEKWLDAIKILDELLEKSGDYKDVVQLLKDAKKQSRLKELYVEAKRLHAAQEWQAVMRIFDQIGGIDSGFPDPDRLLPSAQKELIELKRLDELNDLYSQGIHKMDGGQWYEARALLEKVHKAQTGFLDTERLLRKAENEILKIEEISKRNIQVNTLYEQVHKLVRSKNWHKAFNTIEEIRRVDDQFVDQDGIFERVRAELDREQQEAQRQSELGALHAEAVSLLEAKKYQEALEKWNAIQAIDPKYKDTARVRATAKRRLDELSSTESLVRPWTKRVTDWITVNTNIPADHVILTEKLLLLSFISIFIIVILYSVIRDWLRIRELAAVAQFLVYLLLGGLYGVVVAFVLNNIIDNWSRKQSLTVIIGWALAQSVPWVVRKYFEVDFITIYALFAGLSIAVGIKWARPATQAIPLIIIFLSWLLVWKGGGLLGVYLQSVFSTQYVWTIADPLSILLGLLFTFGIQSEGSWEVLRTAFFGALGFGVGNAIAYIISTSLQLPVEISFVVWGIIGGVILEVPSLDLRRILFSAAMCGIGLFVGSYVAFEALPAIGVQYANSGFSVKNATLNQPFLGAGLGLALGLLISRVSASGVLAILAAGMYLITHALNVEFFNLAPLWESAARGALIGFVLAYGYGYLRKANALEIEPHMTKTKWVWIAMIALLVIAIPIAIWLSSSQQFTSYRWDFNTSTEGWGDYHDLSTPHKTANSLKFTSTGTDPSFESPFVLAISASKTPVITVRMRLSKGQASLGHIFFITNQDNTWDENKSVSFTLIPGAIFRTYNILMSEKPAWQGTITKIRLDPVDDPVEAGIQIDIDYISVHAP